MAEVHEQPPGVAHAAYVTELDASIVRRRRACPAWVRSIFVDPAEVTTSHADEVAMLVEFLARFGHVLTGSVQVSDG